MLSYWASGTIAQPVSIHVTFIACGVYGIPRVWLDIVPGGGGWLVMSKCTPLIAPGEPRSHASGDLRAVTYEHAENVYEALAQIAVDTPRSPVNTRQL